MKSNKKDVSKLGLSGYRMVAGKLTPWQPLEYKNYEGNTNVRSK